MSNPGEVKLYRAILLRAYLDVSNDPITYYEEISEFISSEEFEEYVYNAELDINNVRGIFKQKLASLFN